MLFTTRKMKTVLPSLKSKIPDDLKSRVIYEITCSGCKSSYVGQTTRHLMTRLAEHARNSSPMGRHLENCTGHAPLINAKILDQCEDPGRLLTLEALYIARKQPTLNQREEYRQRQLTLKLWSRVRRPKNPSPKVPWGSTGFWILGWWNSSLFRLRSARYVEPCTISIWLFS